MNGGDQPQIRDHGRGEPMARGANIGRYLVLGMVGRGGMGEVYAAYDPKLDRKVAVKLVRAGSGSAGDAADRRTRLLREAQAIAKLSNPNVVVVYDVGTFDDSVFIAMEFVEGNTVGYWLHAQARSWREVLSVYRFAGAGLAAAHAAGMVHRDFKPDNVMIAPDGQVRVMDFGLARQVLEKERATRKRLAVSSVPPDDAREAEETAALAGMDLDQTAVLGSVAVPAGRPPAQLFDSKLTQTGAMLGTPAYMAPEQFLGRPSDARSDQFSFCVALYEALYQRRPFAGSTPAELMRNVLAGEVAEPPAGTRVPTWLHRILLRGLRCEPAQRFPSVTALLAALSQDPARRRQRWVTVGVAVTALGAVAATGWNASRERPDPCTAGPQKLAGLWELEAAQRPGRGSNQLSPRRDAIRRAFLATGKPFAASAFTGAAGILDRYLGQWTSAYADACRATNVRHEQSTEVLDLRMSCLGERLERARALTDLFVDGNPTVVENAVVAASALPALDRCSDVPLLRSVIQPPADKATHAKVEALRRELAQVRALADSGQCAKEAAEGSKLVDAAFTLGYLPLQAETLNTLATFGNECTDPDRAVRQYKEALWVAEASHHDEAAAEALIAIAELEASHLHEIGRARDWISLASATLQRIGPGHPRLEASRLSALGIISLKEGQPDEGLAFLKQSLELEERTVGAEHVEIVRALDLLAVALQERGRFEESLDHLERARRMAGKLVGPAHPLTALTIDHEGESLNALHRYAEALPLIEGALRIWRDAGSDSFYVARALVGRGECLLGLGKPEDARADLEAALRMQAPGATAAAAEFALARALWPAPSQHPRAASLALEARRALAATGAATWRLAEIDRWLEAAQEPPRRTRR